MKDDKAIDVRRSDLPATMGELARFALIGRDKLQAVRAEISAIKKVGLASEVLEQKRAEAQEIAELVTLSEMRMGEMLMEIPKQQGARTDLQLVSTDAPKLKTDAIASLGISRDNAKRYQQMAAHPDIVEQAIAEARENDDIVSRAAVLKKIKAENKREQIRAAQEHIAEQTRRNECKAVLAIGDSIGATCPCDLLLTDPPYMTDVDDIGAFVKSWLRPALAGVKPTGFAYVFVGAYPEELKAYLNAETPSHIELAQVLVWEYKNTLGAAPKSRYKQNWQACLFYRGCDAPDLDCPLTSEQWAVHEVNAPDGRQGDRLHTWQKPMELAERFIRHSTEKGMAVYDPFACTGTFLIAAAKLGRRAFGYEIDPGNAAIAYARGCANG